MWLFWKKKTCRWILFTEFWFWGHPLVWRDVTMCLDLYLLMLSSWHGRQLKVLNCQYFLLLPPLLAADPVGRREKLGSSLTLCSAGSTPTLPSSAASAGLLISRVHCGEKLAGGHSTGLGPAGLPTTAAQLHYTAFLNFPLRALNSPPLFQTL